MPYEIHVTEETYHLSQKKKKKKLCLPAMEPRLDVRKPETGALARAPLCPRLLPGPGLRCCASPNQPLPLRPHFSLVAPAQAASVSMGITERLPSHLSSRKPASSLPSEESRSSGRLICLRRLRPPRASLPSLAHSPLAAALCFLFFQPL